MKVKGLRFKERGAVNANTVGLAESLWKRGFWSDRAGSNPRSLPP